MSEPTTIFNSCTPREDVLQGTLEEQQFAAKLASVAFNPEDAASVYRDPTEFFDSTYPTGGLRDLMTNLVDRFLVPQGYEPEYKSSILCLDTTFGGGKTHDLIAAYHLAESGGEVDDLDRFLNDGEELATSYRDALGSGLNVRTSVIVGGFIDARNARADRSDPDAPNTNTIWGEIAYQLYGQEGYEHIKEYDQDRGAPGENTLRSLFELSDDPVLILVDEIAEYLEDASAVEIGGATLASQTVSFMKSLLEAAASAKSVTVVYSVADDAFGEKAKEVQKEIKDLDSIEKRKQRAITPTGDNEVSAVLRNRLFDSVDPGAAETVADTYTQLYKEADRTLPSRTQSPDYSGLLERHYPLHPTVIQTLTEKVDSIQDFQRTRGALKLVARAIHHLWSRNQGSDGEPVSHERHLLRLSDLTPADDAPSGSIRTILFNVLFDHVDLRSAIKADIYNSDGTAHAQLEDKHWTEKGYPPFGSHVVTTTLWHSLAIGEQAVGLTRGELYENLAHPDISFDDYDAALNSLTGENIDRACHYLYDEERLKFKSEANLIRLIDQYTDNTANAQARSRLRNRLTKEVGSSGGFETEMFPDTPAQLPDKADRPRIAVLHFESVSVSDDDETPALIQTLYEKTAKHHDSPPQNRSYRNYVLFVAPDKDQIGSALDEARRLEAMEQLRDDAHSTADLSDRQLNELRDRLDKTRGLFGQAVRNAYRHLFYPDWEGLQHTKIHSVDANGDTTIVDAVDKTMADERIIRADDDAWAPFWFENKLWQRTKDRMSTNALARQFARKPGLDFLLSTKPLRATVVRLVEEADYAYWDGETETLYWSGDENPEGWPHDAPISSSDDVRSSIRIGDVQVGDQHFVYDNISVLLDQQELETPVSECHECGKSIQNPVGEPPYFCEDCGETDVRCSACGKIIDSPSTDRPSVCEECQEAPQEENWSAKTDNLSASHAISRVKDDASITTNGRTPALKHLTIEVGGSSKFEHGEFLANQLRDYADHTRVEVSYQAQNSAGTTTFQANFKGKLDDFRKLKVPLETFTNEPTDRMVDLAITIDLPSPIPMNGREDHPLADLESVLDGTNLTLQIAAEGPIQEDDGGAQ